MEKALKKEHGQMGKIGAAQNQTVRQEEESVMNMDEEEAAVLEEESYSIKRLQPPKTMIE